MCALQIDPYAARLWFKPTRPLSPGSWREILISYMEGLGGGCAAAGPCVIGHIKCLVLDKEKRFLRISVISATRPAEVEGELHGESDELMVSLNVIVYGLTRGQLDRIVREAATRVAAGTIEKITIEPVLHDHEHAVCDSHEGSHHHKYDGDDPHAGHHLHDRLKMGRVGVHGVKSTGK